METLDNAPKNKCDAAASSIDDGRGSRIQRDDGMFVLCVCFQGQISLLTSLLAFLDG